MIEVSFHLVGGWTRTTPDVPSVGDILVFFSGLIPSTVLVIKSTCEMRQF